MTAYYNEFDPKAAAWLRELIKQGHIADGVVDERSIEDVTPNELAGFTQCHFFAGIGVWSYALRRAGWSDNRPVWTGSCPCQPFSAAGKGAGFADERHLWPAFHHLISQCRPPIVLGEQVASKDGLVWLDLVQSDLEATGYASGAVDLCAAGVGAPHIRQRLWWVGKRLGDTASTGLEGTRGQGIEGNNSRPANASSDVGLAYPTSGGRQHDPSGEPAGILLGTFEDTGDRSESGGHNPSDGGMANTSSAGCETLTVECRRSGKGDGAGWAGGERQPDASILDGRLADTSGIGRKRREGSEVGSEHDGADAGRQPCDDGAVSGDEVGNGPQRPSPTNGHWRDADWLFCRDGKWRPVEPGTSPLVNGAAARMVQSSDNGEPINAEKSAEARVMRLKGYGNAIVAQAAQAFIKSVMD